MRELHGRCHCGNVAYVLRWPLDDNFPVRRCACSFCTKQGSLYLGHPDAALSVRITDLEGLSRYRFGTKTADFCFCSNCGAFLFVTSMIDDRLFAVLNIHSLDDVPSYADVETRNFDGESPDERLARRSRGWIANVTMTKV